MTPDDLRNLLADYDAGNLTEGEVSGMVARRVIEELVRVVQQDSPYQLFSSWCAAETPRSTIVVRVSIDINAQSIRIDRLP
jgi:hypothetical protein